MVSGQTARLRQEDTKKDFEQELTEITEERGFIYSEALFG
jgi:hypothetical protein